MSETKSKTKMKSGTIAVIALSVVLVLSLITTITLAYFTATRNVITTIQFSNGVTLQMYGVNFKDTSKGTVDTPPTTGAADLYWLASYVSSSENAQGGTGTNIKQDEDTTNQGGYIDVNAQIKFDDLKVRTVDNGAYVAIRLIEKATDRSGSDVTATKLTEENGYVKPTFENVWKDYAGHTDWKVYSTSTNPEKLSNNNVTLDNYADTQNDPNSYTAIISGYKLPGGEESVANQKVNNFAGLKIQFDVYVIASDTLAGLNELVTAWDAAWNLAHPGS